MSSHRRAAPEAEIVVCADRATLLERAVRHVMEAASLGIAARGRFSIALSGGSTPRPLYERLAASPAREAIDWRRAQVFWSDERRVPPDDERSNHHMAREALLDHVPVPPEQIHRMRGEDGEGDRAAGEYERTLRWALGGSHGRPPRLDIVLLGLGAEGHIASLFPGSLALDSEKLVTAVRHAGDPPPPVDRLTMTPAAMNAAREVVFLVAGADKAEAVRATLEGPRDPTRWPAQAIVPHDGRAAWILDREAASGLDLAARSPATAP